MPVLATLQEKLFGSAQGIPERPVRKVDWLWFPATALTYIAVRLTLQWDWLSMGGMFAESGDYFVIARSDDLRERFFALDFAFVPLVSRLFGALGVFLGIGAAHMPYYFSATGILVQAIAGASFALPYFRPLLVEDWARAVIGLTAVSAGSFETASFINFPYYAALPIMALAAMAALPGSKPAPAIAWCLPVFFMSKPLMISLAPLAFLGVVLGKGRTRPLFLAALAIAAAQAWIIMANSGRSVEAGWESTSAVGSLLDKIAVLPINFLGVLGGFAFGPVAFKSNQIFLGNHVFVLVGLGLIALVALSWVAWTTRIGTVRAMILLSVLAMIANIALATLVFRANWGPDFTGLRHLHAHRHIFICYVATVLIVAAMARHVADLLANTAFVRFSRPGTAGVLFLFWAIGSGWAIYGPLGLLPEMSLAGASDWIRRAGEIDRSVGKACVAVDPFGFTSGENCASIATGSGATPAYRDPRAFTLRPGFGATRFPVVPPKDLAASFTVGFPLRAEGASSVAGKIRVSLGTATICQIEGRVLPRGSVLYCDGILNDGETRSDWAVTVEGPVRLHGDATTGTAAALWIFRKN
ncbi:MAG: hypothetical protein FJX47_02295 [Alphaproteobacteria bacterium]|nr:hypothetical protein [Alphaproteobacteria bacterium]